MKKLRIFYYNHSTKLIDFFQDVTHKTFSGHIYLLTHTELKKRAWERTLEPEFLDHFKIICEIDEKIEFKADDLLIIDDIDLYFLFRENFKRDMYLNVLKGFDLFSNIFIFINLAKLNDLSQENLKLLNELLNDFRYEITSYKLLVDGAIPSHKFFKIYPLISSALIKKYLKIIGALGYFAKGHFLFKIPFLKENVWLIVREEDLDLVFPKYFNQLDLFYKVLVISKYHFNLHVLLTTAFLSLKMKFITLCFAENE